MGFVIRSRKLGPPGAVVLRAEVSEPLDTGRCAGTREERDAGLVVVGAFGLDVDDDRKEFLVAAGVGFGSCFAFEAAVGAVR